MPVWRTFVQSERLGDLAKALGEAGDGDVRIVKSFASDPGPAPLAAKAAVIDKIFGHDTVEQCLEAARSSGDDWSSRCGGGDGGKSPTSLKVTLAALRHACRWAALKTA